MTPPPNLVPSGSSYNGSGYSHWGGKVAENGSTFMPEPNYARGLGPNLVEPWCVASDSRRWREQKLYAYFEGSSVDDRVSTESKYMRFYDDRDLLGWHDVFCSFDRFISAICEVTGMQFICNLCNLQLLVQFAIAICNFPSLAAKLPCMADELCAPAQQTLPTQQRLNARLLTAAVCSRLPLRTEPARGAQWLCRWVHACLQDNGCARLGSSESWWPVTAWAG